MSRDAHGCHITLTDGEMYRGALVAELTISNSSRVSVLGPTAVSGVVLTRRQRPLVSALAFRAPRSASLETLVDCVWPEGAPNSARQSIHNQVARLRDQFGGDLIETVPSGYRLARRTDIDDVQQIISPWLFRPATATAIAPLEFALSLWRGTPYLDLSDWHEVLPEQTRLNQIRRRTSEALAVSRMVAGDFSGAATELLALTAHNPYSERAWALLMLALHLGGRRTDALATFDEARNHFASGLGAKPSAAMSELRSLIDRGDQVHLHEWADIATPSAVTHSIETTGVRCMNCDRDIWSEVPNDRHLRVVSAGEAGINRGHEMLSNQRMLFDETLQRTAQ
ncbi:MAG: BTAD domain-containing putative transcriptional regulator [Acidimicrobiales bacterium]